MSETIPTDANSAHSSTTTSKKHIKKPKYEKIKLPTPPPDPTTLKESKEKDVFEYLDTLIPNYSRSISTFAPVTVTEEAFDHLEKLYKLMEQMLELREQNAKLHRRVRDLEHLSNLEKMQRQLEASGVEKECPELERDTAFAETILESILADSSRKEQKQKVVTPTRLRPSILRKQRNRRGSTTTEKQVTLDANAIVQQDDSCADHDKSAKVSKWTKVKAAFRWEKASTSVGDNKSQDSGIHVPVNVEIARYLRVPSTSDDTGHSPADSGAAGISTPGSLSTASSTEDFHRMELRTPCEELRSSEDEHYQHNYIPHSKDEQSSSKTHLRIHRTPWEKMKGIIPSRSSFKKKHRLSAASDDIQIDVEPCSDEEVFEDEPPSRSTQMENYPAQYVKIITNDIPQDVIERYQKALAESIDKDTSKWTMVKKAFLTREYQQKSCPEYTLEDEIQRDYRKLQKKLSLEFQEKLSEWERFKQNSPGASSPSSACGFVEENKDPDFLKKMEEWQKIKNHQSTPKTQMPSEFDLPPQFKKKLQEWEKIKKSSAKESGEKKKKLGEVGRWKSLSGHRSETSTNFEYPPLSEDFRRKLDEWKQIKAGASGSLAPAQIRQKEKTPSPKLIRKNSSPKHSKKHKDQDLHWVEKELTKIEKEKQRLERERQKFLDREERLSKLRKSVIGGNKKEVLIHTPSGFYRFEGISRKFTQKLYEWEKAKGIAPEASTFALLSSSYTTDNKPIYNRHSTSNTPPLTRSLSADSIAISAANLTCPLMTHQLSSLSLNDVDELEKECLGDSKCSSIQFLMDSEEGLDADEPEAVLVEVEDYEEETAAPLPMFIEKKQLPIYQRQEVKALCEGETVAAPKIRRSESARAQTNYNLIEDVIIILRQLAENEVEIKNLSQDTRQTQDTLTKLTAIYGSQVQVCNKLMKMLQSLQEANASVITMISREENNCPINLNDTFEAVHDLSNEVLQLANGMDQLLKKRSNEHFTAADKSYMTVFENIMDIRTKILELRRRLSYVCASTDLTAPRKLSGRKKTLVQKTISNESKSSRCDTSDNSRRGSQRDEKRYIKSEISSTNIHSQGAVKKRIKYRQKVMQNRSLPDTDEEDEDEVDQRKCNRQHKKLTRAKTLTECNVNPLTEQEIAALNAQNVIVPTEINFVSAAQDEPKESKFPPDSPLTVFVKTTRKLFTPIGETSLSDSSKYSPKSQSYDTQGNTEPVSKDPEEKVTQKDNSNSQISKNTVEQETVKYLPPPSPSPVPQRKVLKDISPSIRLMLAKYNQKIAEQDCPSAKSGNSSGSNSPIAWRSPTSERRVKAQTEKYQEEVLKMSPLLGGRREVQKSASVSFLNAGNKQVTVPVRRESVQGNIISRPDTTTKNSKITEENPVESSQSADVQRKSLTLNIPQNNGKHSSDIRLKKIQKAKEEFLRSTPTSAPAHICNEIIQFPSRNRLSQISVDSESSYDNTLPGALIKSASVGMINVDPDTYRQIDPELHGGGYVSLPRSTSNHKGNKFGFASIASKFRKVKMRKGKERSKDSMNAVSALCRHSLVVDITKTSLQDDSVEGGGLEAPSTSASLNHNSVGNASNNSQHSEREDSASTSTKCNTSWLKKSLFKK